MLISITYITTFAVAVLASLHEECDCIYNGIYIYNNCYKRRETKGSFNNQMTYCMGLGGTQYRSYIAHLLLSAILQVFVAFVTTVTWETYVGVRDSKPTATDLSKTYWKYRWYYGIEDDQFVHQGISNTYFVQNVERRDEVHETENAAMWLYFGGNPHKARQSDWGINTELTAFCQINDNIREHEVTGFNLRLTRPPILDSMNTTIRIKCVHLCVKHLLCMGFNFHAETGTCEILSWTVVDAGNQYLHHENGWIHFERKL